MNYQVPSIIMVIAISIGYSVFFKHNIFYNSRAKETRKIMTIVLINLLIDTSYCYSGKIFHRYYSLAVTLINNYLTWNPLAPII